MRRNECACERIDVREVQVLSRLESRTCNRKQLRHREVGWEAAGGERAVCRITNSIRLGIPDEPAHSWRSLGLRYQASRRAESDVIKLRRRGARWLETECSGRQDTLSRET